jgi:hypothetical protein
MRQPQLASDAPWKQRFRVPLTFADIARANPSRGLAASNRSGVYQLWVSRICRGRFADYSASESAKEFFPILTRIERKVSREFGFLMRQ